jgi:hypothetical protein
MQDGIDELGSNPGDTIESIIQRLTLIITNPLCVDWNPGSGGGGGGGGGIIQVGLVAPSNLFETPIVPVTTPGGDLTLTLNDQNSNTVFAGPTSGPANTPQFRALVIDDIPALTTGSSVLMGNGAGKFTNVTIGPNLSFSGGVLDANINVVIGADNGLTKDPLNTDTVWLGGPSSAPGTLIQETFIDTTNQYRLVIFGTNPDLNRGVLEVEHGGVETAIKANASFNGGATAISAITASGTAVHANDTASGIGLLAESNSGTAINYNSTSKSGITGSAADENIFTITSTTPPNDGIISSVLRLTKKYNASSVIGIGSRLDFGFYNSANTDKTSSTIASVTTAITAASETADLIFSTIGNGTIEVVGQFIGGSGLNNGQFRLNKYGINTFNVGTPLYGLAVDLDGKVMEVALASGLGTVDNGLRLNPTVSSEAWLGGTLVDDTTITVPDGNLFEISGTTITGSDSVLEVNNTAGATGTRALSVSSGGLEPAVHVTQDTTATSSSVKVINDSTNASAYGLDVETKSLPIWARTTQSANTTQVQLLKLHNQTGGSGGNGIGGYISLNAATVGNADQEAARIGYQFTDASTSTRKGQLEFYTANGAVFAQRMVIKETGQVQLNNYTTSTSFTTAVGASLLGVDTSGNVVNSIGENGLTYSTTTGNIKLGGTLLENTTITGNDKSLTLTFNDLINEEGFNVRSTGNTTATSGQKLIKATLNGANAANNVASSAIFGLNTHSGTGSTNYGVTGFASTGDNNYGVFGQVASSVASGAGVFGDVPAGSTAFGVYGNSAGTQAGVYARSTNTSGIGLTVQATGSSAQGAQISGGVRGLSATCNSASTHTYAVAGTSTSPSFGTLYAQTTNGRAIWLNNFNISPAPINTSKTAIGVKQSYAGVATAAGYGASIDFDLQFGSDATLDVGQSNSIISRITDATYATRTSELVITGVDSTITKTLLQIEGSGIFTLTQGLSEYADDVAAAAGGIPLNSLYRTASVVKIRVS